MKQVFHNYLLWEDYREGMYKKTCFMDEREMIEDCKQTLSCPQWLEQVMRVVVHSWEIAAEQNLTNLARNRQAWLGQAACCFVHGAPEYLTKIAWGELTEDQQKNANIVADSVIQTWEKAWELRCLKNSLV